MGMQQSSVEFDHFSHRFIANSHPLYPQMPNLKLLHERLTSKQYILNVLNTNDQIQRLKLQNLICKKIANKSTFVTPVQQYIFDQIDGYCGKLTKCYIVFQIGKSSVKSLKHFLVQKQCLREKAFSLQQMEDSIGHICNAILWLKFADHRHGNLSTQTIYFDPYENIFVLSDPWTAPLKQKSAGQYPSPQKLAKINNDSDFQDPYLSDLFSYGMVVLEIMFGRLNVYKANNKIDIKKIAQTVNMVERESLKQKLRVILVGSKDQKNTLLHSYINNGKRVETILASGNNYQTRSMTNNTNFTLKGHIQQNNQDNGIQGRDEPQPGLSNIRFKTLGGGSLNGRSYSKSFRRHQNLNRNDKPPQVRMITNANTNGYQKLSRLNPNPNTTIITTAIPQIRSYRQASMQKNQASRQEFHQYKSSYPINDVRKPTQVNYVQQHSLFPMNTNSYMNANIQPKIDSNRFGQVLQKDNNQGSLMHNKNVQIATSHIFEYSQPKEADFRPYFPGTQYNKPNQFQRQNYVQTKKNYDYSVMRLDIQNDIYRKNYENKPFASDFTNLFQQTKELKKSEKFPTQGTPNDTPNQSRNSNILNSQNSQQNIMHNNANLVGRINEGFNSLQNKITSAFTYEPTISEKQNQQLAKGICNMVKYDHQNYPYKNANFSKNIIGSGDNNFSAYSIKNKDTNDNKEIKEIIERQSINQSQQISLKASPNQIFKAQQKSIDFLDTPTSLIKIEQNNNTLQYASYLIKDSEQRIKSADRLKLSPNLQEIDEMESASPPTKAGPSRQRENQQYFLSYSYSDSNPGTLSRRQSQTNLQAEETIPEGIQPEVSKQQIPDSQSDATEQIANKLSPTGFPLKQVRNLIIYEESDGDSDSSTKQRQRGDPVEEIYQNGGRYKGYILNGKRDGQGTFYYKDGGYYQGSWKNNMMNGYGKLFYDTGKIAYEGYWYKDQFHGRGKVYNDSPQLLKNSFDYTNFQNIQLYWQYYEGDLVHDSKEGSGKIMLSNGESFEGQFHNDKVHGKGIFKTLEGRIIRGIWQNCKLVKFIN